MTARMRTICPHCRRIVPARRVCVCGGGRMSERERMAAEPWRAFYEHPSYRCNRTARYDLAGGRCESCGKPLKGGRYPHGAAWQCDHHVEARHFADAESANAVANLRCYCTACHAGARKPTP